MSPSTTQCVLPCCPAFNVHSSKQLSDVRKTLIFFFGFFSGSTKVLSPLMLCKPQYAQGAAEQLLSAHGLRTEAKSGFMQELVFGWGKGTETQVPVVKAWAWKCLTHSVFFLSKWQSFVRCLLSTTFHFFLVFIISCPNSSLAMKTAERLRRNNGYRLTWIWNIHNLDTARSHDLG